MEPVLFALERSRGLDLERGLATEWLETDGLGGFASSTLWMCPTRRYHGLLVGRPPGSDKRHVFLSRFEETIRQGDRSFAISMARYPGTWAPEGHICARRFELAPHPRTVFRIGEAEVLREVQMVRERPVVLVRYALLGDAPPTRIELRPFLPFREADALTQANDVIDGEATALPAGVSFTPYADLPTLSLTLGPAAHDFEADPHWYEDLELAAELRRGYPGTEDQFTPGVLSAELTRKGLVLAATIEAPVKRPRALWKRELERRTTVLKDLTAEGGAPGSMEVRAAFAADDFLFRDPRGRLGVNAGYPWFVEWGRDAFIALPGLTLARAQPERCAEALSGALEYLQDGLLPNIYGGTKAASHYGSVDAALWFARAVRLYERGGGSEERVLDEYLPALEEIAAAYWEGTSLGIAADEAGLIRAGDASLNPTWMDARTSAGPVTPRNGFAVEINALWYALLQHLERLLGEAGRKKDKRRWSERRRSAKRGFLARFWLGRGALSGGRVARRPSRSVGTPEHGARGVAGVQPAGARAARRRRAPRRGRAAHAARAAHARALGPALRRTLPRRTGGTRRGLPPGHRLAVAPGVLHRGLPARVRNQEGASRRARVPVGSVGLGARPPRPEPRVRGLRRRRAPPARRLDRPGVEHGGAPAGAGDARRTPAMNTRP